MTIRSQKQVRKLVDCCELELALPQETLLLRVEVFERIDGTGTFTARIWRLESYRLQSTFPQADGQPSHEPSDEVILKEFEGFESPLEEPRPFASPVAAREYVLECLDVWLESHS